MPWRKRARDSNEQDNNEESTGNGNGEVSGYEHFRNQRIKENLERMQKLGIPDLSQKLKSKTSSPKTTPRNPSQRKTQNPLPLPASPRRSSRLKSLTPVGYSEIRGKKKRNSSGNDEIHIREGLQPEIYSEEHDKLLGDCKNNWTLFVDGYGEDGKRIYDPVKGKTCHQCRQKTLGQHTHCIKCNLVQGQFCGDCLYMRYGENVIEANENPNWICPVCRGICNCSLCRQGKGWMPTGSLYRKVLRLGFKSVAHYLIQSRRTQTNLEDSGNETLASPVASQLSELDTDKSPDGFSKPQPEDYIFDNMEEKVKDELQFLVGKKHVDDNCDKDDAVEKTDEMKKKQEDICEPCVEA